MKASTFFLGLATGTVAAAITVLYSTPKSGSEIRTSVKSASTDFKETFGDIKQKVNNLKHSISSLSKEAKETVPGAALGIKQSFENWQHSTEPNRIRLEKELTAIQDALENLEQTIAAHQK
jgi:gas vesicle protein